MDSACVTFNWDYYTTDISSWAFFDMFFRIANQEIRVTEFFADVPYQSGTIAVSLSMGDTFGFGMYF